MGRLLPREIEILCAAAARSARRDFGEGLTSEAELESQRDALLKALGRRGRKQLEGLAEAYIQRPPFDFERWQAASLQHAARTALLVSDDLPFALQAVRVLGVTHLPTEHVDDAPPSTITERIADSSLAQDLCAFWGAPFALAFHDSPV